MRSAGQPEQEVWKGSISTIEQQTQDAGALSPCVLIVGNVVGLALTSTCDA